MTSKRDSGVPVEDAGASLRATILAAKDIQTEEVEVPEWGVTVTVQALSGSARDWLEMRFSGRNGELDREKAGEFRAAFVALSVVDESGERVFSDRDIQALGRKSSVAIQRVYEVAVRLSAARPEDVDGIAEDLKTDPSGATGSD